uniref:Uncharacterized protein n=1 Tax=Arundo donax TaxID=35708 RepID=A0A0A9B5Y1_ARUDO
MCKCPVDPKGQMMTSNPALPSLRAESTIIQSKTHVGVEIIPNCVATDKIKLTHIKNQHDSAEHRNNPLNACGIGNHRIKQYNSWRGGMDT